MRGGKCLGVVARFDASICGVSVDGMDSRADLWKSGGEVVTANYGSRAISDDDANQPYLSGAKHWALCGVVNKSHAKVAKVMDTT